MDWRLLVLKKAIVSRIPFREALRAFRRRKYGYPPDHANLVATLENYSQIKSVIKRAGRSLAGATVLEIGSGWFPVVPIKLVSDGVGRVLMSDLTPHMDAITFVETVQFLKSIYSDDSMIQSLTTIEALPIDYLAPLNVDHIDDNSLDYVISRAVLEHIPPADLRALLIALRPKLSKEGLMVHIIDHSDHLEHFDKSISKINFLTWSQAKHSFLNYLIGYGENRLRHHEYRKIFQESGFEVLEEQADIHDETLEFARSLRLASPFREMTPEQNAVLTSLYVLEPVARSV